MRRRLEGVDTRGNAQEETGEQKVGSLGDISTADVRGQDPTIGSRMGDNGPHPKREGRVPRYWTHWSGMEGMFRSGEFSVEARCCLALLPEQVQRGTGNEDGHTGIQAGPIASGTSTGYPLTGVIRHP